MTSIDVEGKDLIGGWNEFFEESDIEASVAHAAAQVRYGGPMLGYRPERRAEAAQLVRDHINALLDETGIVLKDDLFFGPQGLTRATLAIKLETFEDDPVEVVVRKYLDNLEEPA